MTHPVLEIPVFLVTWGLSALAGGFLIGWFSRAVLKCAAGSLGSPLAPLVGGLEQSLYIASVLGGHYELTAGWLVMKAFFGWLGQDRRSQSQPNPEANNPDLGQYNIYIIGNLLSLLTGLSFGVLADLFIRTLLGHDVVWTL